MGKGIAWWIYCCALVLLLGCDNHAPNNPYPDLTLSDNIRFAAFNSPPKTLDPAKSYVSNEVTFTAQIYEPPLQYHYLLRPYQLVPLTAQAMPEVQFYDRAGQVLGDAPVHDKIAYTRYRIRIKPGIQYASHPAFVKNPQGQYRYHALDKQALKNIKTLYDFKETATRELIAEDYVYQIKRILDPKVQSPILSLMAPLIQGGQAFNSRLENYYKANTNSPNTHPLDLRQFPLAGAKVVDKYTYEVTLKGYYPQFQFWLAMPFFAPLPWEADIFYAQKKLRAKNITLDWYPVGTGPYYLSENNPTSRMVLTKNPNFHGENYPTQAMPSEVKRNLLAQKGAPLPFIDQHIFTLEKESIPHWSKFLQGYYDQAGISADTFEQAITIDEKGQPELSKQLMSHGITLQTSVEPSIFYLGFNMLDRIVGDANPKAIYLRQAISIAIDYDEFVSIFMNGRGEPAMGPIPPGIFGHEAKGLNYNPIVYDWVNERAVRKSLDVAKDLMAKAGYAEGVDPNTGEALILHYDVPANPGPDAQAQLNWMRKQFAKIDISLNIRAIQPSRFQEKLRQGQTQIFWAGWHADYPDAENFFFLLYGPNGKVKHGGENSANYNDAYFNSLFEKMDHLPNNAEREAIIANMIASLQVQAPWVWGFYPKQFTLNQAWMQHTNPMVFGANILKYIALDTTLRQAKVPVWNAPKLQAVVILLLLGVLIVAGIMRFLQQQAARPAVTRKESNV